jgi:hypothetical protein
MAGAPGRSGGARQNAGRPKGPGAPLAQGTILSRRKVAKILGENESPLDFLMDDLRWWKRQIKRLESRIHAEIGPEVSVLEVECNLLVAHYLDARKEGRAAALAAAPWVHPRISPRTVDGSGAVTAQDLAKLTDAELDQLEAITRKIAGAYGSSDAGEPPQGIRLGGTH